MHKLKPERFRQDIRQRFFTMREARHWTRLPREVMRCPSLEISKVVNALSSLVWFHSSPCFEQEIGLKTPWGLFQPEFFHDLVIHKAQWEKEAPKFTSEFWRAPWVLPMFSIQVSTLFANLSFPCRSGIMVCLEHVISWILAQNRATMAIFSQSCGWRRDNSACILCSSLGVERLAWGIHSELHFFHHSLSGFKAMFPRSMP